MPFIATPTSLLPTSPCFILGSFLSHGHFWKATCVQYLPMTVTKYLRQSASKEKRCLLVVPWLVCPITLNSRQGAQSGKGLTLWKEKRAEEQGYTLSDQGCSSRLHSKILPSPRNATLGINLHGPLGNIGPNLALHKWNHMVYDLPRLTLV